MLVASAPDPAVVGTATKGQNFFILYFELLIFSSRFRSPNKQFDVLARSRIAPPPRAIIKSGLKELIANINSFKSNMSGNLLVLKNILYSISNNISFNCSYAPKILNEFFPANTKTFLNFFSFIINLIFAREFFPINSLLCIIKNFS